MTEPSPIADLAPLTVSTPLGVRFWDGVARRLVGDGLNVTARAQGSETARPVRAFANRSGTWVLRDLPGLRDFELAEDRSEFHRDWTPTRWYDIEVADDERRFLPFRFAAQAPRRGFVPFLEGLASPPASRAVDVPDRAVPLYPSPARAVPSGMAVIRMQLREPDADSPPGSRRYAAWAVVDALIDGRVAGTSYADERGRVAIMFPCPGDTWPASPPAPGLLAQRSASPSQEKKDDVDAMIASSKHKKKKGLKKLIPF